MMRVSGGAKVPGGYYWNSKRWDIVTVSGEEGVLEGTFDERFVKVPLLLMIAIAIAVSFAFVVFLPFIGFALLGYAMIKAVGLVGHKTVEGAAAAVSPGWQPGEVHFSGRVEDQERGEAPLEQGEALEDLKKEIDERRRNEP